MMRNTNEKQWGIVAPIMAIALVAIVSVMGLALDTGHAMLNRARVQNALDAAAMAGAKVLDTTSSTENAAEAAKQTFQETLAAPGNQELSGAQITTDFSHDLNPWGPGAEGDLPRFIRVGLIQPLALNTWFSQLGGLNTITVSSTAVAGPSPNFDKPCGVAPVYLCGVENEPLWGYQVGQRMELKLAAGSTDPTGELGAGNYQLLQVGDPGAAQIRLNFAGEVDTCTQSEAVSFNSQPGNVVGPVTQGLNTRFGDYFGPMQDVEAKKLYPPDLVTTEGITFAQYQAKLADATQWDKDPNLDFAKPFRRVLPVPVGACTGDGGRHEINMYGFLCVFMVNRAQQQGRDQTIIGEITPMGCTRNEKPGQDPGDGPGIHTIQLYGDPARWDS